MKIIDEISMNKLVVKDNSLVEAKYNLSTIEQKIVLMLISQIDSMGSDELYHYEFKIQKILNFLDLGNENYSYLQKILENLYKKEVYLESKNKKEKFWSRWITSVFYSGEKGVISLSLDPKLKPFLLKINEKFVKYPLSRVISMKNRYSIRLYELFKKNKNFKQLDITIDALKIKLEIENKYIVFKDFRRAFLEPVIKEINEETELNICYSFKKNGRKFHSVIFKISMKKIKEIEVSNGTLLSDQMLSLGLSYNKIQEFLKKYDEDRIQRNIEHVQNELEKNPNVKNIGGLLNVAIRDDFAYLPPEILKKKRAKEDKKQFETERRKRAETLKNYIEKVKEEIQKDKTKKYDKYIKGLTDEDIEKEKIILWESDHFKIDNEIVYKMGRDSKGGEMLLNIGYKEQVISYENKDIKRVMKKVCKEKEFYEDIFKELSKGESL